MPIGENNSLSIGQIIYVLSNKTQKIIPAIVVEEMTVKKIDGNETSWKVSVGPQGKEKIIDSKRLDGELYANLDEIQSVLQERLGEFINQIVSDARNRAETWYGQKTKSIQQQQLINDKIDPNSLIDEDVPETNIRPSAGLNKAQAAKEARNKLIAAMSDEQKNNPGEIVDSEEIQLPNGQMVKVNIRT